MFAIWKHGSRRAEGALAAGHGVRGQLIGCFGVDGARLRVGPGRDAHPGAPGHPGRRAASDWVLDGTEDVDHERFGGRRRRGTSPATTPSTPPTPALASSPGTQWSPRFAASSRNSAVPHASTPPCRPTRRSTSSIAAGREHRSTSSADRDGHLLSGDFFGAEENPTISFTSTDVARDGSDWTITGDLTIKGTTKSVTIDFEEIGTARDPFGNLRLGFEGSTTINRSDWGLSFNAVLDTGGVLVSEEVQAGVRHLGHRQRLIFATRRHTAPAANSLAAWRGCCFHWLDVITVAASRGADRPPLVLSDSRRGVRRHRSAGAPRPRHGRDRAGRPARRLAPLTPRGVSQTVAVLDGDRLVAYADLTGDRYDTAVHPDHRGRGIGTWLAGWMRARPRTRLTIVGMPARGSAGDQLLAALGYQVRSTSWSLEPPRTLTSRIVERRLPAGFMLRAARRTRTTSRGPRRAGGRLPRVVRCATARPSATGRHVTFAPTRLRAVAPSSGHRCRRRRSSA